MSSRTRLFIVALVTTMLAAMVGIPLAAADPVNNPDSDVITLTCDGVPYEFVVRHPRGSFNVPSAHLAASTGVAPRLLRAHVDVYLEGSLIASFDDDFHHGAVGNGIDAGNVKECLNVIEMGDGTTWYVYNTMVFTPKAIP